MALFISADATAIIDGPPLRSCSIETRNLNPITLNPFSNRDAEREMGLL